MEDQFGNVLVSAAIVYVLAGVFCSSQSLRISGLRKKR